MAEASLSACRRRAPVRRHGWQELERIGGGARHGHWCCSAHDRQRDVLDSQVVIPTPQSTTRGPLTSRQTDISAVCVRSRSCLWQTGFVLPTGPEMATSGEGANVVRSDVDCVCIGIVGLKPKSQDADRGSREDSDRPTRVRHFH